MCVYFCAVFLVFQCVFLVFHSALVCNWSQSDKSISMYRTVCRMSNIICTYVLSVGWAGRWWESRGSPWSSRWHSKSLLMCTPPPFFTLCLLKARTHQNSYYFTDICIVLSGSSRWQGRKRRTRRPRLQSMCPYVLNNCRIFVLVIWYSGLIFNDSQGQVGVDGERGRPGATGQPVSVKKLMMTSTRGSLMMANKMANFICFH